MEGAVAAVEVDPGGEQKEKENVHAPKGENVPPGGDGEGSRKEEKRGAEEDGGKEDRASKPSVPKLKIGGIAAIPPFSAPSAEPKDKDPPPAERGSSSGGSSSARSGRGGRRPSAEGDVKVRTLMDYADAPARMKSAKGIDLEQIKAEPRDEDLTKIKFARFVFNGVNTTVVSRSTKVMDGSAPSPAEEGSGSKDAGSSDRQYTPSKSKPPLSDATTRKRSARQVDESLDNDAQQLAGATADAHKNFAVDGTPLTPRREAALHRAPMSPEQLEGLRVLSEDCIKRIGPGAVGQEYTRQLKEVNKVLDAALRAGIPAKGKDGASLRWDAVHRLSAILHEAHDAQIQTSKALAIEHLKREQAVQEEENAAARAAEAEIRGRLEAELDAEMHALIDAHTTKLQEVERVILGQADKAVAIGERELTERLKAERERDEDILVKESLRLCITTSLHSVSDTMATFPFPSAPAHAQARRDSGSASPVNTHAHTPSHHADPSIGRKQNGLPPSHPPTTPHARQNTPTTHQSPAVHRETSHPPEAIRLVSDSPTMGTPSKRYELAGEAGTPQSVHSTDADPLSLSLASPMSLPRDYPRVAHGATQPASTEKGVTTGIPLSQSSPAQPRQPGDRVIPALEKFGGYNDTTVPAASPNSKRYLF